MRSLPAILLAAVTALVIAASALITAHYGMTDWPTPPMPDTATRPISATEAVGRAAGHGTLPGDDSDVQVIVDTRPGQADRSERRGGGDSSQVRRRISRSGGRRKSDSAIRTRSRSDDARNLSSEPAPQAGQDDGDAAAPAGDPAVAPPAATDAAPVTNASADTQTASAPQTAARPDEPTAAPAPATPVAPSTEQSGDDQQGDHGWRGQRHGTGRGNGRRRGSAAYWLDSRR